MARNGEKRVFFSAFWALIGYFYPEKPLNKRVKTGFLGLFRAFFGLKVYQMYQMYQLFHLCRGTAPLAEYTPIPSSQQRTLPCHRSQSHKFIFIFKPILTPLIFINVS